MLVLIARLVSRRKIVSNNEKQIINEDLQWIRCARYSCNSFTIGIAIDTERDYGRVQMRHVDAFFAESERIVDTCSRRDSVVTNPSFSSSGRDFPDRFANSHRRMYELRTSRDDASLLLRVTCVTYTPPRICPPCCDASSRIINLRLVLAKSNSLGKETSMISVLIWIYFITRFECHFVGSTLEFVWKIFIFVNETIVNYCDSLSRK